MAKNRQAIFGLSLPDCQMASTSSTPAGASISKISCFIVKISLVNESYYIIIYGCAKLSMIYKKPTVTQNT